MQYRIKWLRSARRAYQNLPRRLSQEFADEILGLSEEPYPPHSKPLQRDLEGLHRIRVNGWRLVYRVDEADRVVMIWAIRPRNQTTYIGLP